MACDRVLAWFETTYDLFDGRRVCRTCDAEQYDYPGGHAPGCVVGSALEVMAELTEEIR